MDAQKTGEKRYRALKEKSGGFTFNLKDLLKKEDWMAVWLGLFIIASVLAVRFLSGFDLKLVKFRTFTTPFEGLVSLTDPGFLKSFFMTYVFLSFVFTAGYHFLGQGDWKKFLKGFTCLYLLTSLGYFFAAQKSMKQYLEYAFFTLFTGLAVSNIFGVPDFLKPALKSEFYVKTGLVIMGSEVIFSNITGFGFYGLGIAWVVVPVVIIFMWWFGNRILRMESKPMIMVISVATAVCGVSAAIAAAAASKARKNDLTFAVSLSMLFTILMMVSMPWIAKVTGMGELIGGAWIGNTVDSTGAVVLAGEALGQKAAQAAALLKMIQNVLIGFISLAVALFFASSENSAGREETETGAGEIWNRMPKFIFGFLISSLIFSFVITPYAGHQATSEIISLLGTFKGWCFALAFLTIGLDTNFKEMKVSSEGGKPLALYLTGQIFSMIISLFFCYLFLSGRFLPLPDLSM